MADKGKQSYGGKGSGGGLNPWIGWGISTLLLLFLNRGSDDSGTEPEQPSKFTDTNGNQIGNPIPVVMGRCMIKNPLIAYYGDFAYAIYTEEYGMHSGLNVWEFLLPLILSLIMAVSQPDSIVYAGGSGTEVSPELSAEADAFIMGMPGTRIPSNLMAITTGGTGPVVGSVNFAKTGQKRAQIVNVLAYLIVWLLLQLFNNHEGRTTIQKGFKYYLGWQCILCWTDENIGIKKIWMNVYDTEVEESTEQGVWDNNNHIAWEKDNMNGISAYIDDDQMFGGWDEGGGFIGEIRFYFGNNTQPKDPWMIRQMTISDNIPTELKGLTPQYPMFMTCVVSAKGAQEGAYIGKQSTVPEMWFEVVNYPKALGNNTDFAAKIGDDANPAEVIYAILTNKDWGCGYDISEDTVDLDSLKKMGKTLEQEGLGISCLMTNISQANEYISKILTHINGVKYDDPLTGKLTFKLIRDDYDRDELKVFDTSNCSEMEFSRLDWSETTSGISLTFTLAEDKYDSAELNVKDLANVRLKGYYTEKTVDGAYFTTPQNAKVMAQTQLLSAAYPLSAINFKTNRFGFDTTIGDPIVVSWKPYGIDKQVFRITDLDYATLTSGEISVTAMEDVFGFDKSEYDYADIPKWTDPARIPEDIQYYEFFEAPYELTLSLDTYMRAYAVCPSSTTDYWSVWRFGDNEYKRKSESGTWSMAGYMSYGYDEGYPKDSGGFEFDPVGVDTRRMLEEKVELIRNNPYSYNADSGLNLLLVDGEIMSYDNMTILPNGRFYISGIIRGVYDTVPKVHTIESMVWFLDNYQDVNDRQRIAVQGMFSDESLELTTRSTEREQAFDPNKTINIRTARRSECPSIMGNLQFGADRGTQTEYRYNYPSGTQFSHNIEFQFKGRNKFSRSRIMEQVEPTIDVAKNTKNVIRIMCVDKEFEWKFDAYANNATLETMEAKWVEFCKEMTNINGTTSTVEKIAELNYCTFEIQTYNPDKELYSYDKYVKEVLWVVPRMVGVVTDDSLVQSYADDIVRETTVVLPATSVNPQLTLNFEDCCLVFVGKLASSDLSYTGQTWLGQDGNRYILSPTAYRIDGSNTTYDQFNIPHYSAIVHKVDIEEEYIFRSNFNIVLENYADGIRYRSNQFLGYQFYLP